MEPKAAADRMRTLCSRREYCRSEIRAKLQRLEVPAPDKILDTLQSEGYINEERYAAAFARDKSALQGWGLVKIRLALRSKGISDECIREALSSIDTDKASSKLENLLKARLRTLADETEEVRWMKLLRYAAGRGYDYEQIKHCYDNIRTT